MYTNSIVQEFLILYFLHVIKTKYTLFQFIKNKFKKNKNILYRQFAYIHI